MIDEVTITTLGGAESERLTFAKDGTAVEIRCRRHGGCSYYRVEMEDLLEVVATLFKREVRAQCE